MGNPKVGVDGMAPHTQQKVAIYGAYLARYLKIITQSSYDQVNIFDPFAGCGKYGEYDGSAVVACKSILNVRGSVYCDCQLYLNEPDEKNKVELQKHCSFDFVKCIDNIDANEFIAKYCRRSMRGHSLWFIDPYGYTQVLRRSLDAVMSRRGTEIVLFIPLSFIYRFLDAREGDASLKPIATFLENYSISPEEARKCGTPEQFAGMISRKLQNEYGFCWHATMQEKAQYYSLFFIGKHPYGLEKFLEARDVILKDETMQQFTLMPMGDENDLLKMLQEFKVVNNYEMYICGLKNGFTPKAINNHLKKLEDRGAIAVAPREGVQRKRKAFYIGREYYDNKDLRINISVLQQQLRLG